MTITTKLVMVFVESSNIRRIERTYSFESPEFDENLNANEYKMAKFTRPPHIILLIIGTIFVHAPKTHRPVDEAEFRYVTTIHICLSRSCKYCHFVLIRIYIFVKLGRFEGVSPFNSPYVTTFSKYHNQHCSNCHKVTGYLANSYSSYSLIQTNTSPQ